MSSVPQSRQASNTSSLIRQLGIASATALVVSNMVGTGIFTTTGFLAGQLGAANLILIIWAVGAVCALAGAFALSELGVNFPSSGGEYVYLTEAYGPTWGFMSGWTSFFAGFSAPIAAAALAFSDYLGHFYPALRQENAPVVLGGIRIGGAQFAASGLILVFTLLNCLGVRRTARVQNVLTAAKIAIIAAFIAAGLAFGAGDWRHFSEPAVRTTSMPLWSQFVISLYYIYFSYSGWNAATYIAEELKSPARTLPASLAIGTGLVAALFIALNIVFIYAMPLEAMKDRVAIGALTSSALFGPAIAGFFSAGMALSLTATVNAFITVGPRVYYAMARNGAFFASAAKVDRRWHTPVVAILAQGLCAVLMTMSPFLELLLYIGVCLNFFMVLAVGSLFIFRRRPGWRKLRVVSFGYPAIPAFFVIVGIWMTILGLTFRPVVSGIAIATIAAGALVYHGRRRRA